jgi:hypothetical protein
MADPIRRKAHLTRCKCGEHILVGLDDNVAALSARADIYPLSNLGEVEALRSGRWTYWLRDRMLDRRGQFDIRGHAASTITVVAEHRCGEPIPATWRRPIHTPTPRRTVDADF